ncbi:hypothetical protein NDU88_004273 [Pleurodeles waltl]|uniref:Uncharacterized protein n=1 Tax=Pleurodeles waltl TaxID=8319 RepID=A0AAV7PBZ5_PLEWA|nr:hypothetical protein NDU88_004273 [Pleurodeles waltl]
MCSDLAELGAEDRCGRTLDGRQTAGCAEERTPRINLKRRGHRAGGAHLQPLDSGAGDLTGAGSLLEVRRAPEV